MRAVAVLFVLVLAACATGASNGEWLDRDWTLVSPATPANVTTPTIRFGSDGRLTGNTGCNMASGTYTVTGDQLTFGPLITTKRACAEDAGNELERQYVAAIEAAQRYRIVNGELELLGTNGDVVARFR